MVKISSDSRTHQIFENRFISLLKIRRKNNEVSVVFWLVPIRHLLAESQQGNIKKNFFSGGNLRDLGIVGIFLLKVNNRNSDICANLTIKTPEQRYWRRSGIFIVNFEHISYFVLVLLLLNLNM